MIKTKCRPIPETVDPDIAGAQVEALDFEPMLLLRSDLKELARTMTPKQVRGLVDMYYIVQKNRCRAKAQMRELQEAGEPYAIIEWLFKNQSKLERATQGALGHFAEAHPVGRWSIAQYGIGPVISAGLIAHIDILKAPHVGHIWAFAGLTNERWNKAEKRPWNAKLKRLCFIIGDCMWKFHNQPDCYYGRLMAKRKLLECERNERGDYADQAKKALQEKDYGDDTVAKPFMEGRYLPVRFQAGTEPKTCGLSLAKSNGIVVQSMTGHFFAEQENGIQMLSPAHVHARAIRWTAKLFLSHWHHVQFRVTFGKEPPLPWIFEHGDEKHEGYILPPPPIVW